MLRSLPMSESPAPRLTERQRAIVDCIAGSVRDRGYPPTIREIAEHVGVSSTNTVHGHLLHLAKIGVLDWSVGKPRTLHLLVPDEAR